MKIFVSHITEEAPIALAIKEWVESTFAGQCDVFVSSDRQDLPPGSQWLAGIDSALNDARALIVICSPSSIARLWVNFETGCAWIKRLPILPVCHSGQRKSELPPPLSLFQALEIDAEDFVRTFLSGLAGHLEIKRLRPMCKALCTQSFLPAWFRPEGLRTGWIGVRSRRIGKRIS